MALSLLRLGTKRTHLDFQCLFTREPKMRAQEEAILVGTQTVLDDNPKLSLRDWPGKNLLGCIGSV